MSWLYIYIHILALNIICMYVCDLKRYLSLFRYDFLCGLKKLLSLFLGMYTDIIMYIHSFIIS